MKLGRLVCVVGIGLAAWVGWVMTAAAQQDTGTETATFSMYCYWTGEATLGRLDGLVASRIGHWGGREIVQVDYDASKTDLDEMVRALKQRSSFYSVVTPDAKARDEARQVVDADEVVLFEGKPHFIEPKHSLRVAKPKIYALDLTEAQAIRLNAWAHFGGPMPDVLTVEQLEQLGMSRP